MAFSKLPPGATIDGLIMTYDGFLIIKKTEINAKIDPIEINETWISFVIAEKTIPVNNMIGTSLKIRHQRDDFENVPCLICLIIFAIKCWYPNNKISNVAFK